MGFPRSSNFAFWPLMPVAKVGFTLPIPFSFNSYRKPNADSATWDVAGSAREFSTADLRHSFAIKALEKRGVFKPTPYVYICLRCRYIFLVNEGRGSIVALDRRAQPIPEPENSRRLATFAQGPCPAFKAATRRGRRETVELTKPKGLSPSGILGLLALIGVRMRYPYFVESNINAPAGILPQDLLS